MVTGFNSYIVDNDKLFQQAISRAQGVVSDLSIPFHLILNDFYRSEEAIFQLQSAGKYPPISEKYGQRKEKRYGFRYPLLVRTGRLADSVTSPTAPEAIAEITPSSITIGTTVPYAIYHQSDAPRAKIPQRKFLFIGPEAPQYATSDQMGRTERWLNILNDYVLKAVKRG